MSANAGGASLPGPQGLTAWRDSRKILLPAAPGAGFASTRDARRALRIRLPKKDPTGPSDDPLLENGCVSEGGPTGPSEVRVRRTDAFRRKTARAHPRSGFGERTRLRRRTGRVHPRVRLRRTDAFQKDSGPSEVRLRRTDTFPAFPGAPPGTAEAPAAARTQLRSTREAAAGQARAATTSRRASP